MIEELRIKQIQKIKEKKKRTRKIIIFFIIILLFMIVSVIIISSSVDKNFGITRYILESGKIDGKIKIVALSDLHNKEYGENNINLIKAIDTEEPDMIVMLGDMVNQDEDNLSIIRYLCQELMKIAPVYYALGNHEGTMMTREENTIAIDQILQEEGVHVLCNRYELFHKNGLTICIGGITTNEKNYDDWSEEAMKEFFENDSYKILLSHFPSVYYERLKNEQFDLAFAGHYHGGMIRIPILGGVYHPETGFFPRYSGGCYKLTFGKLIVSRGLGNHGMIPRINNKPELLVVEVQG